MKHEEEEGVESISSANGSGGEGSDEEEPDEHPPKPVSSDDDTSADSASSSDDDRWSDGGTAARKDRSATAFSSRIYAPYRTVGVVSSGAPFFLCQHENSDSHLLCMPIGDRFQLVRTDRLQPVLVSRAVPTIKPPSGSRKRGGDDATDASNSRSGNAFIAHCVSDSSLSVTVVAHGTSTSRCCSYLTLYRRTHPIQTQPAPLRHQARDWTVVSLLHLGRVKQSVAVAGDKAGRRQNVAVVAAVLAKTAAPADKDEDSVIVVENDQEDDDDSSVDDVNLSSRKSGGSDGEGDTLGQVVLFLASRSALTMHRRIRLDHHSRFRPVTATHPATYLNKIVLGGLGYPGTTGSSKNGPVGQMLLVNVRSSKVIHQFRCLPPDCLTVTALEQAPVVDTVAVGTECGRVLLVNLKVDKLLFSLRHPCPVSSLSFRTDASALQYGIAPLAVGRADGAITVWDLSPPQDGGAVGRAILCEMKQCHPGGIAKLQYLPEEPLLVSVGGRSNALTMHIFDSPTHAGRVLKERRGHMAPPTLIRYLHEPSGGVLQHDGTDAAACQILSTGGLDRSLRIFSTARSVLDREFSQGKGLEKRAKELGMESKVELLLPPVKGFALSDVRSRDWGDLVTIHRDHSFAYVWSTKRGAQSGPVLKQPGWNISAMKAPPPSSTRATSVALSACGNFALVGTVGGIIYKYNVQSGNPRGSYPRNDDDDPTKGNKRHLVPGDITRTIKALEKSSKISNRVSNLDKQDLNAEQVAMREQRLRSKIARASHSGFAVTGMAVDSVNRTVVTVGADKKLILWNFVTHAPHKNSPYMLPAAATMMRHLRESDLAAIALQDFSLMLFDCSSLEIVRRFGAGASGHKGPISDVCFSPDGRSLLTSSLDGTIRVYDVPTSSCIEWLSFRAPPTSMTMSSTGEFLATTHLGKLGIRIWSDRSYYQTVHSYGGTLNEPVNMDDPIPISDGSSYSEEGIGTAQVDPSGVTPGSQRNITSGEDATQKQLGLVTLSGLPPTHWKTLFHLELIKERNKPIEPPKKPPTAPFFLQWRTGETLESRETVEPNAASATSRVEGDEEWAAAWSDDDAEDDDSESVEMKKAMTVKKRDSGNQVALPKRRKVSHHRSHLASLLMQNDASRKNSNEVGFKHVSEYMATLGPSAIDVALSSLCSGSHDLEDGLPLLILASSWLTEACRSRDRFEVINAYVHRFLHLHGPLLVQLQVLSRESSETAARPAKKIAELSLSVENLRKAQVAAADALREKVQNSLCLIRHLSRMV